MAEEALAGGVANAGGVVRSDGYILRPTNPYSRSIHWFLSELRSAGFDGVPDPVGIDADGRERLVFIDGDVPLPPYPTWAQTDNALGSIAELLRRMHDVAGTLDPTGMIWSDELSDPQGGQVVCHNDVCLENVVFQNGRAIALVDFDFAAPGRPVYDLAQFARMCVPIDDEVNATRLGWLPADRPARLRLIADNYGLDDDARGDLVRQVTTSIERGGEFVRRRVEAGDPNFIKMWTEMGGEQRFDRRLAWWTVRGPSFAAALR